MDAFHFKKRKKNKVILVISHWNKLHLFTPCLPFIYDQTDQEFTFLQSEHDSSEPEKPWNVTSDNTAKQDLERGAAKDNSKSTSCLSFSLS